MPTQIQSRPTPPESIRRTSMPDTSSGFHHHEHPTKNSISPQHRDALMLALGSILAPKRPSVSRSSSSHSSSGTASPFSAHGSASPLLPPVPQSTPVASDPHSHSHTHAHAHVPSRLGLHHHDSSPSETPIQAPVPRSAAASAPVSGTVTPKAKFLETLQSKSAWEALIHGSFS